MIPISPLPSWRDDALCVQVDVGDLFFPEPRSSTATAKRICAGCPVREACLADALTNREVGVWGGTDDRDRRLLIRRMQRKGEAPPAPKRGLAPCGTPAAARRHWRNGEPACAACAEAANRARIERRATAVEPRKPIEHGTRRGYEAHQRMREKACDECAEAMRAYKAERRAAERRGVAA